MGSRHAVMCITVLSMALRASGQECQMYTFGATAPSTVSVPGTYGGASNWIRLGEGDWQRLTVSSADQVTSIIFTADLLTPGGATVVLGKPDWMVLDDSRTPTLDGVALNGAKVAVAGETGHLDLGAIPAGPVDVELSFADDANPLDPDSVRVRTLPDQAETALRGLDGRTRNGSVHIRVPHVGPGSHAWTVTAADRSPNRNTISITLAFRVIGVVVADARQRIRITTPGGEFVFQPDIANQLQLPGGLWAKYTSNVRKTWLYPRDFTAVNVEEAAHSRTVAVTATTQGIKGDAVDGLGALEFELTTRDDTPALLITSRTASLTAKREPCTANWGWLPAPYYATPEGRRDWTGRSTNSYVTLGRKKWVWLPPRSGGASGLVWMSNATFGESRFDTMLLYADSAECARDEAIEVQFAIAPADSPEHAARIFADLERLGLFGDAVRP